MYYLSVIFYLMFSFMIGGIPFGFILSKIIKNTDIRKVGSGNIGATNIYRFMGFKYAALVFILDGLKSYLPVFASKFLFNNDIALLTLCATVLGHIFSPWLGFKGGKGVSSFILGILALDVRLFFINAVSWLIIFFITRISAVAGLLSITLTVISSYFINDYKILPLFLTLIIIFWAHRNNIKGIIKKFKER